jgi:glycosyltransferase involved in cell wall biosynthesis
VPAERITVALLGPGQELDAAGPRPEPPRHFLYVGDGEPRKNLGVLLAAYALYRSLAAGEPLKLVLAGSATASQPGVECEPGPDRRRLGELYRTAAALVHPALHEGFGLTPLEAMRLGTPVLAAPVAGVVDVCGSAARYAAASDAQAFAAAMAALGGDPQLRAALRERGVRRAADFSWATCARAHADAYSLALTP